MKGEEKARAEQDEEAELERIRAGVDDDVEGRGRPMAGNWEFQED